MKRITPFLWFDGNAEEAAKFYISIFKNSKIVSISHYDEAGSKASGMPVGTAMTIEFELNGQVFIALNGGSHFKFTEAISFVIPCEGQDEIDYYWEKLSDGGDESAQQCGWLKDKFGLSWQIVPADLGKMLGGSDSEKSQKVMKAMLQMKKIIIANLEQA